MRLSFCPASIKTCPVEVSPTLRPNLIARRVGLFCSHDKYLLLRAENSNPMRTPGGTMKGGGGGDLFPVSQRHRNCSLYAEFAFTFSQLMKLKRHILASIGKASRPKCQRLPDFAIRFEQTPRREGIWHGVIDRVPLQRLIRALSAIIPVQYGGRI